MLAKFLLMLRCLNIKRGDYGMEMKQEARELQYELAVKLLDLMVNGELF